MPEDLDSIFGINSQSNPNQAPSIPAYANVIPTSSSPVSPAMKRYTDAYRVARTIVTFGTIIKAIGAVLGVIIWLVVSTLGSLAGRGDASVAGFILAVVVGGIVFVLFYIFGVIVSANGQMLKANLDSAVHSSPFLSNEQKAQVMSLI